MTAPELGALARPGFVDGIDVSSVQGQIDWEKVADAGFRFVVVKVSEGIGLDPRRLVHLDGARAAKLRTAVYHFGRVMVDPVAQVHALWDGMGDTMPVRAALDLETAPLRATGSELNDWALRFADEAERYFGRPPLLYTYPAFASRFRPLASGLARCPLWIAQYRSTTLPWVPPAGFRPIVPEPWSDWAIHQYSGNGGFRVPGVPGDCDRNLFNGDDDAFRDFCGLPADVQAHDDERLKRECEDE